MKNSLFVSNSQDLGDGKCLPDPDEEIRRFKTVNNSGVTSDPYFDRMSWIEIHFAKTVASRVEIGKIESY